MTEKLTEALEKLQGGVNCDQCFDEELGESTVKATKYCENCKFFYCQKCWDEQDCMIPFDKHRSLLDPPEEEIITDRTPDDFYWEDEYWTDNGIW